MTEFIQKFLSGLSPLGRQMFVAALFLLVLTAFERLYLSQQLAQLKKVNDTIISEQNKLAQDQVFLSRKDKIVKEAGAFRGYFTQDVRAEEEVIADTLKQVELMATQAGVQMSKISPMGQDYQKDFLKYSVALDCSGSLENVTRFIHTVNNSAELFKVEKVTLGAAKGGEAVQASFTISRMIVGLDPSLDARKLVRNSADADQGKGTAAKAE